MFFNSFAFSHLLAIVDSSLFFFFFNLSLMHQNFNLAKPRAPFCLTQSAVFLSAPSYGVLNQVMSLFFEFWSFFTQPIYFHLSFCWQSHLPLADPGFFLFSRFCNFFRDFRDFRYVSFLFLSYRVKNHISILWNRNMF